MVSKTGTDRKNRVLLTGFQPSSIRTKFIIVKKYMRMMDDIFWARPTIPTFAEGDIMLKGGKFLKKQWCCVGGRV